MAGQMMNTIKLSRGDSSPWGFRLQGGKDWSLPLSVSKVRTLCLFYFILYLHFHFRLHNIVISYLKFRHLILYNVCFYFFFFLHFFSF